jgi:hypothetical protein
MGSKEFNRQLAIIEARYPHIFEYGIDFKTGKSPDTIHNYFVINQQGIAYQLGFFKDKPLPKQIQDEVTVAFNTTFFF